VKRKAAVNFESTLLELEQLVERMERGELTLEESLRQFEHGITLARACQLALQAAEQKVEMLTRNSAGETLSPLDVETEPEDD
jgi:exodeoxyribonuclease VII small subunit